MSDAQASQITRKPVIVEKIKRRRPVEANTQGAVPQPANCSEVRFPRCDAAVRKTEGGEWELADAIVAECSETGEDGVRNGSQAKIEAMREEIAKNHGVELSLERMRKLRKVASNFPPGRRRLAVSIESHLEAGTPDALDALIKSVPKGTALTRANIRKLKHPNEKAEQSTQKEERRHQIEDHRKSLQDLCRQLEQEKEERSSGIPICAAASTRRPSRFHRRWRRKKNRRSRLPKI